MNEVVRAGYANRRSATLAAEFRAQAAEMRERSTASRLSRLRAFVEDFLTASPSDRPRYETRLRHEMARAGQHPRAAA